MSDPRNIDDRLVGGLVALASSAAVLDKIPFISESFNSVAEGKILGIALAVGAAAFTYGAVSHGLPAWRQSKKFL